MPTSVTADGVTLRRARPADRPAIIALLEAEGLPTADVASDLRHFVVACAGRQVIGGAGLEGEGRARLLRSVVVDPAWQGRGLGSRLVGSMLRRARAEGGRSLFLLTTNAQPFFARLGFVACAREDVPAGVRRSAEFRGACPATAIVMRGVARNELSPLAPARRGRGARASRSPAVRASRVEHQSSLRRESQSPPGDSSRRLPSRPVARGAGRRRGWPGRSRRSPA